MLESLPALERHDPEVEARVMGALRMDLPRLKAACVARAEGRVPLELPSEWWVALQPPACAAGGQTLLKLLLRAEGRRLGEEHRNPDPLVIGEKELDILLYRNGAAGDLLRSEIEAIARWVVAGEPISRLQAAFAHPEAEGPAADLLGVPWDASGSLGDTAALVAMVLAQTGLEGQLKYQPGGFEIQVGERSLMLGEHCGEPMELPTEGALALGLVQAMGRSLRNGDREAARAQGEAAGQLWRGPPAQLAALLASALGPAPEGGQTAALLLPRTLPAPAAPRVRRGRRKAPPAPPPAVDPWARARRSAEAQAAPILAAAGLGELALISAWADRYGDPLLADRLLPDHPGSPGAAWATAAQALGEPVGSPTAAAPCTLPFWEAALRL